MSDPAATGDERGDRYDRLQRALETWLDFVQRGEGGDPAAFLAGVDPELRPLLEPLIDVRPEPAAAQPAPRPVARRIGDFRIIREIGRGGMGVVFEAEDESLGRRVALKVLGPHCSWSGAGIERFRREAAAAARLRHPGIAQVFRIGQTDDAHWIALELVEGRNLRDCFEQHEPLGLTAQANRIADVAELGAQIAEALDFAHRHHVVHRDIKPHNVLLDADGRARLVDFGLAKLLDEDSLSITGDFAGSLAYASPEQVEGRSDLDARTDIWSLGVLLYEALAGARPFEAPSHDAIVRAILTREPKAPPGPRDVQTICLKALEKEPHRRYATAGEMAADLRRFLALEPIEASPPSSASRLLRFVRRRRMAATAVAATVALVAVSVAFALNDRSQRDTVNRAVASAEVMLTELEDMIGTTSGSATAAEVLRQRRQLERLVAESERVLGLQPDNHSLQRIVARAHERAAVIYHALRLDTEALRAHGRALELLETAIAAEPGDSMAAAAAAGVLHNRHVLLRGLGRDAEADADLRRAIERWEEVVATDGEADDASASLAIALTNRARSRLGSAAAGADLERAAGLWRPLWARGALTPQQAVQAIDTDLTRGQQAFECGLGARARELVDEVLGRVDGLPDDVAERADATEQRVRALLLRGRVARIEGRVDDARQALETAVALQAELAADGVADRVLFLGVAQFSLAALFVEHEIELDRAETLLQACERGARGLLARSPELLEAKERLAKIASLRASLAMGARAEGDVIEQAFERAIGTWQALAEVDDRESFRIDLAEIEGIYGGWLMGQDRLEDAERVLRRALAATEDALAREPGHPILQRNVRVQCRSLLSVLDRRYDRSGMVEVAERLHAALPKDAEALGMALFALERVVVLGPPAERNAAGREQVTRLLGWLAAADAAGVAWRESSWIGRLKLLPHEPRLAEALRAPATATAQERDGR